MKSRKLLSVVGLLLVGGVLWAANSDNGVSVRALPGAYNRTKIDDSSGTVELVAAVSGKRIQVWGVTLATASATTMEFKSATTSHTGPMSITALQIDTPAGNSIPWIECATGEAFNLSLGGAVRVTGQVIWTATTP